MRFDECATPGCWIVTLDLLRDGRGSFVKSYHQGAFAERGLDLGHAEEYFTYSRARVLRGLHFQTPPREYTKAVTCVSGEVLDAIVDLRAGSPTYGRCETFVLRGDDPRVLHLPPGIAHGFYVTGDHALMHYTVSAVHSPEHDAGILWSSAGVPWPDADPIVSDRDRQHPALAQFASPFRFEGRPR